MEEQAAHGMPFRPVLRNQWVRPLVNHGTTSEMDQDAGEEGVVGVEPRVNGVPQHTRQQAAQGMSFRPVLRNQWVRPLFNHGTTSEMVQDVHSQSTRSFGNGHTGFNPNYLSNLMGPGTDSEDEPM
jgi:hypothetical protein